MGTGQMGAGAVHAGAAGTGRMDAVRMSAARMAALGRAELTLLVRNRTALLVALLLPVALVFSFRSTIAKVDLGGTGMDVTEVSMTGGIGIVLVFVVYCNLVSSYVARREELVLKRLRTGEPTDVEILSGSALPSAAMAVAQCVLMIAAGAALLGLDAPRRPELLLAGVALGIVMMAAFAAASAIVTRTVESAQITIMPLMLVSFAGSGMLVPLEIMPERLADVLRLLPMTPIVDLVRAGWLGGAEAAEVLRALVLAVVWTGLAVFAVRRWFRWEPRR